jgi:thiol-disulfide isomerase/thioredoxin
MKKAMLFYQVLGDEETTKKLLAAVVADFPGTKIAGKAERTLQSMTPEAKANAKADGEARRVKAAALIGAPAPELRIKWSSQADLKTLSSLNGQVVVLDFWATWCGPCIAELPNLLRVYEQYHPQGFEIVGISFENSGVVDEETRRNPRNAGRPLDTPEQAAAKLAAARQKLTDFTRDRKMPWPQHFDGRYWDNEFGRQFNIRSIPAMFLLDREGRIVDTNARGAKLEPQVRRLLGL